MGRRSLQAGSPPPRRAQGLTVRRRLLLVSGALVLAVLCGYTQFALAQGPYPQSPYPQAPVPHDALRVGPGAGVRTTMSPMLRPLRDDVRITPILSVGDTLAPADTQT